MRRYLLVMAALAAGLLLASGGCSSDSGKKAGGDADVAGGEGTVEPDAEGEDLPGEAGPDAVEDVGVEEGRGTDAAGEEGLGPCGGEPCGEHAHCDDALDECVCDEGFEPAGEEGCVALPEDLLAVFDDLEVPDAGYWNGSDGSGGFQSGTLWFVNDYNSEYGSWNGWAYSKMSDTATPGFENQYSAAAGMGAEESEVFAVAYDASGMGAPLPAIELPDGPTTFAPAGMFVTNTTYAHLSMLQGDDFAKKFGGEEGTDPDWFLLTISGTDAKGNDAGKVEFYLADFRSDEPGKDYIVKEWTWVDLSSIGQVVKLTFSLTSSDMGEWGMNTPAFFAIDQIHGEVQ